MKKENGNKSKNITNQYIITALDMELNKGISPEDETKLQNILENDENIKDLRTNRNSRLKKFFNIKIIKQLIAYCLEPGHNFNKELKNNLRYTYYACQLLCSPIVLMFNLSIKNIKDANNNNNQESEDYKVKNNKDKDNGNYNLLSKSQEINYNNALFNDDYISEMLFIPFSEEKDDSYCENYFEFINSFETDEKFAQITDQEIKKTTKKYLTNTFNEEDKKIINEILNEIFKKFDFNYKGDETYFGYFQKIINYMIMYETEIIMDYLFIDPPKINIFYQHIDKIAMENIFENILNTLVDQEDKKIDLLISRYYKIIQDLLKELTKNSNYEKAEAICELIINTLLVNNEKVLNKLIFGNKDDNNMIKILFNYIKELINKENYRDNEKIIVNIIILLCQINNIIMTSFYESSYYKKNNNYLSLFIEDNKKINTFEYQYIPKNVISMTKIFEAYNDNNLFYLSTLNDIYNLIILDIIQKYKEIKYNNNSDNSIIIKHNYNKNNQQFGLFHLYEWKFVLSSLKIYIYSFFAIEGLESEDLKYFENEELFIILIKLYFYFPQNNIYHNIFIEIIKLICNERCPEYLIQPFLRIDENTHQNKFINKLINNLKTNLNEKHKLLVGTNIEVLKIFYSSYNPTIKKHFETSELDNNFKDIFDDLIIPKLKRQLLDDYEYDDSEIFNNYNDNNRTFDGNDIDLERNYNSFLTSVQKFIEKVEKEKKEFINNNNNTMKEGLKINKKKIKQINQKNKIEDYQNICKEERTIIDNEDEENHFSSETSIVMTLND